MKAAFYTLGCKVNQYETQAMMKQMAAAGYEVEEHAGGAADVLVINSCTVTGESDRKLRQLLEKLDHGLLRLGNSAHSGESPACLYGNLPISLLKRHVSGVFFYGKTYNLEIVKINIR